jgi:hypothetical protein
MKKLLILFLAPLFLFSSCSNEKKYNIQSNDKYEKGKASLEEIEKKSPEKFLAVSGNSKKNLLMQTVVKGKVYNNAKIVSFKDVAIKLKFYSKTGTLLEEDTDVIYETIGPGGSSSFKSKFFAPKGTDSVAMSIAGAKY